MVGKRRRLLVITAVIIVILVGVFTVAELYRDRDYLDYFVALKGQIDKVSETVIEDGPGYRLSQIELTDDRGLEVVGYLKTPTAGEGPFPTLLVLGGVRTGKRTLEYLQDTPGVIILALDYPYDGKKSGYGVWEFIRAAPAIRQALFNTVPASMLAVDYLLGRSDVDAERMIFAGGSVGALLGPVVGAADERLVAVALLFGAGDIQSIMRVNMHVPAPLAAAGSWFISLLISPLEPLKYVGRIAPRPLFMLNGTGDDRMPVHNSRVLHEAAGEPKTIRWIDTGHVDVRATEFHEIVREELVAWLLENDLVSVEAVRSAQDE